MPRLRTAGVLLVFLLIAGVYTHPLLRDASNRIANDPYDPILNASILWWNATVLPFSPAWWTPPHFYPSRDAAAFTENLAGISPIASPILWATGNPLLAYNLALFLTWPLSAFAGYLLVLVLTHRRDAAFVGGLAFGFAPYRVGQVAHIQVLSAYYLPIALVGLHLYLRDRRARWLALFGAAWLLQSLANGYFMLFGGVLIGLWLLYFCSRRDTWNALPPIAGAWLLASLPLVPVFLGYRAIQNHYGLSRGVSAATAYSAEPWAWARVSQWIGFWYPALQDTNPEVNLFPGATALALVVVAAAAFALRGVRVPPAGADGPAGARTSSRAGRMASQRAWQVGARWLSAAIALLAATGVVAALVAGPWRLSVAGITVRTGNLTRPLVVALVAAAAFAWLSPRVRTALGRRSTIVFYSAATMAVAAFCMGPAVRVRGHVLLDPAPYGLLMQLPGFEGLRVPTRFWMLGALCLAAAAGLAFARVAPRRRLPRAALLTLVTAGLLVDCWIPGIPMAAAPQPLPLAEPAGTAVPLIELPLGPDWDAAATFRAVGHGRRVVNGVSGYDPPHYVALQLGLNARDPEVLLALASLGPLDAVVNGDDDPGGVIERYVREIEGATRVGGEHGRSTYRLSGVASREVRLGERLPLPALASSAGRDAAAAVDGRIDTLWHVGDPEPGQWVLADLGSIREVGAVVMALGTARLDFPRYLAIDVSSDGVSWRRAFERSALGEAVLAAIRSPREVPLTFRLETPARFIRLSEPTAHATTWTIAELSVHAPARSASTAPRR